MTRQIGLYPPDSLASVTLPDGLTSTGPAAPSCVQPSGLTSIGAHLHRRLHLPTSLVSIALPDGAASVGDRAFDLTMAQCHPGCSTNAALTATLVLVSYKSLLTAAAETYARLFSVRRLGGSVDAKV